MILIGKFVCAHIGFLTFPSGCYKHRGKLNIRCSGYKDISFKQLFRGRGKFFIVQHSCYSLIFIIPRSLLIAFSFLTKCCIIYSALCPGCQICVFFSQHSLDLFILFSKCCLKTRNKYNIFSPSQNVIVRVVKRMFIYRLDSNVRMSWLVKLLICKKIHVR